MTFRAAAPSGPSTFKGPAASRGMPWCRYNVDRRRLRLRVVEDVVGRFFNRAGFNRCARLRREGGQYVQGLAAASVGGRDGAHRTRSGFERFEEHSVHRHARAKQLQASLEAFMGLEMAADAQRDLPEGQRCELVVVYSRSISRAVPPRPRNIMAVSSSKARDWRPIWSFSTSGDSGPLPAEPPSERDPTMTIN